MKDEFSRLTEKQRLYAELAVVGSYADAYRSVYSAEGWSTFHIGNACSKLNNHPLIMRYMQKLRDETAAKHSINRDFLVRWHWLRLVYDPAELTRIVRGSCRFCRGEGHLYQWRAQEYLDRVAEAERTKQPLPDLAGGFGFNHLAPPVDTCPNCHGAGQTHTWFADTLELSEAGRAAFEGVKETRNGIEVLMADKAKAADALAKLLGLDVQQVKVFAEFPSAEVMASMTAEDIAQSYKTLVSGG